MHHTKGGLGDSEAYWRNNSMLVEKWGLGAREAAANFS